MSKKLPMVGNPYLRTLENAGGGYGAEVLAQLAIAYEQRTANLIAYTALTVQVQLSGVRSGQDLTERGELIEERLGLGENK